ncbi:hypothetical protein [Leucothrix arctica]|uniref:Uncharacterized protein n=1 Tax=Leucothrix arctica TaxID=1481894 RepID=A0A317CLI9_9GAMM|nr:hypothetical protein [Leucothrix arctica]PWQ98313.1 hypothetical protein DKT75_04055 [Leucothrix arctica]
MLFSRREQLPTLEPSFTQRFSSKLGQYLALSNTREVKQPKKKQMLNVHACYALLGEKTEDKQYKLTDLQQQLEKLAKLYEKKSNRRLGLEQLALATLKIDAEKEAEILRHRFFNQNFIDCRLFSNTTTSPLHLALLSDALNITTFTDTTAQAPVPEFKACRHMLNVMLNDVSMQDIETYYRDLRESCSEVMSERGVDAESLQSNWQLRMRYDNSSNSLLMKCMPIDMLRDTFKRQHKAAFGQTNSNQDILIEALEVTVSSEDEAAPGAPANSNYVKRFMQAWQINTDLTWSKTLDTTILDNDISYLECPVLHKIISSRLKESTESKVSDFFIQKI